MTNCFKVFIAKHLENSAATGSQETVYQDWLCPASLDATNILLNQTTVKQNSVDL